MKRHKFNEEHHDTARRRRIEELRARESAGLHYGEDTIWDGGEIAVSPDSNFHKAAMKDGEIKEHYTE